ncbi:unnamed protein product [Periconia digitata]|uniref:Ankyrin n=1 Tax=Periconia digitata TaxID=1303443 RepID=A0A9W4XQS0_9PLEO|nr:unnamed protein product [Periconia digitata]
MDPVSASASILTLVGAAGGSCKFLHSFILDIADAPREIRISNQKLCCLARSFDCLTNVYSKVPSHYRIDSTVVHELELFIQEIFTINKVVKSKAASLIDEGSVKQLWHSFRWLLFDRRLQKFFASLEHWNIVFSQAVAISQLSLLTNIEATLTSLISLQQKLPDNQKSAPQIFFPSSSRLADIYSIRKPLEGLDHDGGEPVAPRQQSRDSRQQLYLQQLINTLEPVNVIRAFIHRTGYSPLSCEIGIGPVTMQTWTASGKRQYRASTLLQGIGAYVSVQELVVFKRKISMLITCCWGLGRPDGLDFRIRLRCPRVVQYDDPITRVIRNGDILSLRQLLTSRTAKLSDVTKHGDSLLHLAVQEEQENVVSFLLDQGIDINVMNDTGETPLHTCIEMGRNENCAKLLLSKGADPYCQEVGGRTALHTYYNPVSKRILQENYEDLDPWTQDHEGMTFLHFLCWSSRSTMELLQRIELQDNQSYKSKGSCLDLKDSFGRSMLHFAAQRGNIELVQFFLARPNVDMLAKPDWHGKTLLHYATESSRVHTIDLILRAGFDLNARDDSGCTLLHQAAMKDNVAAFKRLLDLGAWHQLTSINRNNESPYQTALSYHSKDLLLYLDSLKHSESLFVLPENNKSEPTASTSPYTHAGKYFQMQGFWGKVSSMYNAWLMALLLIVFWCTFISSSSRSSTTTY